MLNHVVLLMSNMAPKEVKLSLGGVKKIILSHVYSTDKHTVHKWIYSISVIIKFHWKEPL